MSSPARSAPVLAAARSKKLLGPEGTVPAVSSDPGLSSELDLLRHEYESSLSWRVTRPLRALGRLARGRGRTPESEPSPSPFTFGAGRYDSWLEHFHGDRLGPIDAACARGGPERFALFRDLDLDLWALLLTQEYEVYPNIRAVLPNVPDASLQEVWNGASGAELAVQSKSFFSKLCELFQRHSDLPLADARVLDFGCGWGRLTRFFARDVEPGQLYGCDPVEGILDVCRENGVPATLARTNFLPERLPFDAHFDLAFAFSVFTHVSEAAHQTCLRALHGSLRPGGILVLTVRPPEYLHSCERMRPLLESLGPDPASKLEDPRYFFVPHPAEPSHFQYAGGEMTYGETVVTFPYIRERWSSIFELLDVNLLLGDLHQVVITLRRR
jgi:SAM-dependent methyltransferase